MKYRSDGHSWLVRFEKGEKLVEGLVNVVRQENIRGGWVSGLGGALSAELGFYHLEEQTYEWKKFDQLLEIVSLQGNIAWQDDKPVLHIHGSFSDKNMHAFGGHVKELVTGGTAEVMIHRWNEQDDLSRVKDEGTGLNLLGL